MFCYPGYIYDIIAYRSCIFHANEVFSASNAGIAGRTWALTFSLGLRQVVKGVCSVLEVSQERYPLYNVQCEIPASRGDTTTTI